MYFNPNKTGSASENDDKWTKTEIFCDQVASVDFLTLSFIYYQNN